MMYHLDAAMTAYMGGGQAHKKLLFYVDKAIEKLFDEEVQRVQCDAPPSEGVVVPDGHEVQETAPATTANFP